jgi:hypothetical protein
VPYSPFPPPPRGESCVQLSLHTAQPLRSCSLGSAPGSVPSHCSRLHGVCPVDSVRSRWVPLFQSFHRRGAFAVRPHPRVPRLPGLRLLCPIRLCERAWAFRGGLPCLLPTRLDIPHAVSRVRHGRRQRNAGGGVLLSLPRLLLAAPQSLDRGSARVTAVTLALPRGSALVLTRSARVCFQARLADLADTGGQGQPFPKGFPTL